MTNFTGPSNLDQLIGLWDFLSGDETADTGLDDGIAQDGNALDGNGQAPTFSNDQLIVGAGSNSSPTVFDVNADINSSADDEQFNLNAGTLEVQFTQRAHSGSSEDVILSRGEKHIDEDDEGFFEIRVTENGKVQAYHNTDNGDAEATLSTDEDFFSPGDVVNVTYTFDSATGATMIVTNVTTGDVAELTTDVKGLTFDLTDDDDEEFTFGAREKDDGEYDKEFDGSIDYVALYSTDGNGVPVHSNPDGIVDGEEFGEVMLPDYDDANAPTDGGGDIIDGADGIDDVIKGNGGDDSIDGGLGDDLIYGDDAGGNVTMVRESFEWDLAPSADAADFSQDTGNVTVEFSTVSATSNVDDDIASNTQNVSGIDSGSETVDATSSLESVANGSGQSATYSLDFSGPVENVSFRVNDIDGDGIVKIQAFDASGNPIEVILQGGSELTLIDTDGVAGADTADSDGGYLDDTSSEYSVLVTIPGPVSEIRIIHSQDGGNNSGVNVTDVFFDVPVLVDTADGNDTIIGNDGDDTILGEGGDDSIVAGSGDSVTGGEGSDMIVVDADEVDGAGGTSSGIYVDGSTEGSDEDTLDLTDFVYHQNLVETVDADGDSTSGSVEVLNGNNEWVTVTFVEIEKLILPPVVPASPDGVVDGEDFAEDMDLGYNDNNLPTDGGGDQITQGDDSIEGNGGNDTINGAGGSDSISGGTGDDSIDGGTGSDGDSITGDEGNDTIIGQGGDDTISGGDDNDSIDGGLDNDTITGDDGNDTLLGGGGDDTIRGGEGDDSIDGGADDDSLSGNAGGDTILGGGGDDTIDAGFFGTPDRPFDGSPIVNFTGDSFPDDDRDYADGGSGNDFILTGDDNDTIIGGTGSDTIDGGYDDDLIDGGADADSIQGAEGNDTITGGGGNDTIYGDYDDPSVFDVADDGFGAPAPDDNPDNNKDSIDGGSGNDLIFGGDDDDTILGGTGEDTIDGGLDNDSISGGQGDDELEGGHGDDFVEGNNDNDMISGGRGNDTLEGDAGNDTITGGAGDSIVGGGGADSIFIDQDEVDRDGENATAIFADGSTNGVDEDTLDLTDFVEYRNLVETVDSDGDSTSGTVEVRNDEDEWVTVTFAEIEDLLLPPRAPDGVVDGEEFGEVMNPLYDDANAPTDGGGDIIDGPDGLDDSIRGNGGDDTINAGEGNDTVDGGDDDDSILGGTGDDDIMGGSGNDTLRGEADNDTLSGGAGEDSLSGGMGNDVLDGGDDNDSLTGGSGNDTMDGGDGDDTITGSSGRDSITDLDGDNEIYGDSDTSFNPDLGTPIPTTPDGPFIIGTPDSDPDDNRDTITTGDGDDTIFGGDDGDLIDAGDGNNVVDGGTDRDTITTGDGNDEIIGGEGDDLIDAGDGDDTITGGVGLAEANFIDEPNTGFTPDPILDNGDDTILAGEGNDVVFGEDDNDSIEGGGGNDTLDGGIDDDTILGGEGNDSIIGGQGADYLEGGLGNDTFSVGTFTDPNGTGDYAEGVGDTIIGGEDPGDGDVDVLDLAGSVDFDIIYEDSIDPTGTSGESGRVVYYTDDTKTVVKGETIFKEIESVIPCFTPGAMIATPKGEVPVESLREGDKVITRDNGIQEIRWTGSRTLNRTELAEGENLKPILIKAGSLGHNLPERDMLVSPQHRVLVTGETPQLYFEESEVLVAAKHLVGKQGVSIMDTMRTTYIHFMFDQHEVVLSDGAWTESFQPGDQSLGSMGEATRAEIFALFPELQTEGGLVDYAAARRSLKAHEAKLLQL